MTMLRVFAFICLLTIISAPPVSLAQTASSDKAAANSSPDKSQPLKLPELTDYTPESKDMLTLVNNLRLSEGKLPLLPSLELDRVANLRARELAINFSHTRPNGQKVGEFTRSLPYFAGSGAHGENISDGFNTVAEVMAAWESSPPHRTNMLHPFIIMGVGHYVDEDDCHYWVQLFVAGSSSVNEHLHKNLKREIDAQRQKNSLVPFKEDEWLNRAASVRALELRQSKGKSRPDGRPDKSVLTDLDMPKVSFLEISLPNADLNNLYFVPDLKERPPLPKEFMEIIPSIMYNKYSYMGQAVDVDAEGRRNWVVIVTD